MSPIGDTYTEAPSIAGAFLVSGTPHIGSLGCGVLVTVAVCSSGWGGLRVDNYPHNYALVGLMVCQVVAFS